MITIENLDFAYSKQKVFENINLSFEEGCIYGLLGQNGVGKTTLLKLITGLQNADKGRCIIDGKIPFEREPEFLEDIFFLPEEVIAPSDSTPERYVKTTGMFYPNYDHELFVSLMDEMNVDRNKKFEHLSYGQQKKAMFAIALSLKTKYLLLDEPTNGLDIPSKADFRKILAKACTENTTVIISTHQVKDVENLIDSIVILDHDNVLLNASTQEISQKLYFSFDNEKNDEAIYSEMMPGGFINVSLNQGEFESNILVEPLFNAAINNKSLFKKIFDN